MLSYEKQLELKREVVIRAFETFSGMVLRHSRV